MQAAQRTTNMLTQMVYHAKDIVYRTRQCALYKLMEEIGVQVVEIYVDVDDQDSPTYTVTIVEKTSSKSKTELKKIITEFITEANFDYVIDDDTIETFTLKNTSNYEYYKNELENSMNAHKQLLKMMGIS